MNGTVRKSCLLKCIDKKTGSVLFDSIQAFSFDKRFTDLNPSESRKSSSSLIALFTTLKRCNSRISLNEAIQCGLPTSATSRDGTLPVFPALDDVLYPDLTRLLSSSSTNSS